jgi:phosphate transport system permease protein
MTTLSPPKSRLAGTRRDWALRVLVSLAAAAILLMLAGLLVVLLAAAVPSLRTFGARFLVTSEWRPNELERPTLGPDGKMLLDSTGQAITETIPPTFGALPVIFGTAVSSAIALCIAAPLSLGAALFLIRIAPRWLTTPASFLIEFLAAIPSIAYGIWGLFVLGPFLQHQIEPWIISVCGKTGPLAWLVHQTVQGRTIPLAPTGRDMLCGSLVLAIMIVPIITAVSRDVLRQVPTSQLEGTVALGATWWQSCREMLFFARSGLFGAVILGLARAAGETMAITLVIGNSNHIVLSPIAPAQTMASLVATEFADASLDIHRAALCEVALVLLAISLIFNVAARWLVVGKSASRAGAAF